MLISPALPASRDSHRYRADIDGLRAVAIFSVVAFHAHLRSFSGGFIGVDVFLVISGYLIGSLVYREIIESGFSFARFYERRVKRILPALLTVLIICNLIAFIILSPLELRSFCEESFAAAFSSSNVYYWLRSNYFNPVTAFKPLLMAWSLGIEEQFYFLFPLTLFFLHKFAKRWIFQCLAICSLLSLVACAVCTRFYPSAAFYLLPTRAWELGLGILIAIREVERGPLKLSVPSSNILGSLGLGLIVFSVFVYTEATRFPGIAALLPTLGTAFLINSRDSFINRKVLSSSPMVYLGLVSYSWYLWHWPLMSFARIVSGGLLSVSRALVIALLSLLLAVFSYHLVEQPFRRAVTPRPRLFLSYATVIVLIGIASFLGYTKAGWPNRIPELASAEATVHQVEKNICMAGYEESAPRLQAPCVLQTGGPTMVLVGDSHAASLGPTLRRLANQQGFGFESLTKAGCAPLLDVKQQLPLHPEFERSCLDFNRAVVKHILKDPNIKVVFLAGFWSAPYLNHEGFGHQAAFGTDAPLSENYEDLRVGLLKIITRLRASGRRVVVATDVPRFEVDPMSNVRNIVMRRRGELALMLSRHIFSLDPIPEDSLVKPADKIAEGFVRDSATEGGAEIVNLAQNLCPGSRCAFWDNGVLFYSDTHHITPAGAENALRGFNPIADAR